MAMRIGRGREIGRPGRVHQFGGTENGREEMKGSTGRGGPGVGRELQLEGEVTARGAKREIVGGGTRVPGDNLFHSLASL